MDVATYRALTDKAYDKRKTAALELERIVREAASLDDVKKLNHVIAQLCELAASPQANGRSGAIMGLAGVSIALGPKIAQYLGAIVPPILTCFNDPDSKVRYFACESMYNVAKVAKGEILIFFNELFDAMSKLAADTELPVKNGAELLDRLIKDIVTEQASTYVSTFINSTSAPPSPRPSSSASLASMEDYEKPFPQPERAFSLARFIPLLQERIYVINPFTRTYLVSWLTVLDSVPELELVTFLPDFLDGLLKFLGDPTVDIRTATQNVLADFLREIREVAEVRKVREEDWRSSRRGGGGGRGRRRSDEDAATGRSRRTSQSSEGGKSIEGKMEENGVEEDQEENDDDDDDDDNDDGNSFIDDGDEGEGSGAWVPGQGVMVDHASIVEILLQHLAVPDEEIQSTCLRWIAEFLLFVQPTMVPFTPRLIPVILSSLAHHIPSIRTAANETNYNLYKVIQTLPDPILDTSSIGSPPGQNNAFPSVAQGKQPETNASLLKDRISPPVSTSVPFPSIPFPTTTIGSTSRLPSPDGLSTSKREENVINLTSQFESLSNHDHNQTGAGGSHDYSSRPRSVDSYRLGGGGGGGEMDLFDYGATVNALTLQFLNEQEETRVAALEWLLMLHEKAPKKILAIDDPSGEATRSRSRMRNNYDNSESGLTIALLLKMLSDPSEKVLRYDLQLLAQISSSSEDEYFPSFMLSLLSLFSTDRKLLETRGSLIIRQLCLSLNTERIYRTFAEILEKDEDLEFASIMVQNLNLIMITSPELAEFRKRLKSLESKDGQALFTILYRSWSHNAVATFSLCLLAQAYEQACSLLQIFADLEITVSLLIQIDKLVQLLESPVFTSLRLQLLEPDRYPYLLKAMYGLLMLLPQSSAFATLRNRLSAVSSLGFLQTVPKTFPATSTIRSTTSTIRRDDVKWSELLTHFRVVQKRRSSAAVQHGNDSIEPILHQTQQQLHQQHQQQASSNSATQTDGKGVMRRKAVSVSVVGNGSNSRTTTGKTIPRTSSPTLGKKRLTSAPVKESMRK